MKVEEVATRLREVLSKPSVSVLLEIYKTTHTNRPKPAYYSKLVETCGFSKTTTAKALTELEGLNLVTSKWEKISFSEQSRWVRTYQVASEAFPSVEKLAKTLAIK